MFRWGCASWIAFANTKKPSFPSAYDELGRAHRRKEAMRFRLPHLGNAMTHNDVLGQLILVSHRLGRPEMDCLILGEGNTSARIDDQSFWVKASGISLPTITPAGFVRVAFAPVLALLDKTDVNDADVKEALRAAKADADSGHPSVETLLHAQFLQLEGVCFVAHTHPTAVNMLACSRAFPDAFRGRLFPDEIVLCGVAPLLIPYADPGVPLARSVQRLLGEYLDQYGERPKIAILQNHGLIALGGSAQQVEDETAMAIKTARILLGTFGAGGPRFLSPRDVARIHTRPDELYRRTQLGLDPSVK
jgi:rhamnose utilization protein RhaD (predicted bifunctional aldolase and dehydrogenase)